MTGRFGHPSRPVLLATLLASAALAAGGFALGKRDGRPDVPATVPVQPVTAPAAGRPILVPPNVELPPR